MAKKIEMIEDQKELYNDLRLLVKKANQRILRIERLTGLQGTFAVKQLYDYLDISTLEALTKSKRVRLSKKYSTNQMLAIKKALDQFFEEGSTSSIKSIKEKVKDYSVKLGKPISYEQADTLYQSGRNYTWIYGMNRIN